MRMNNGQLQLSATDLIKHLGCRHLSMLDLLAARGDIRRPFWNDPAVAVLEQRGFRHEAAYLAHLESQGREVTRIDALEAGDRREQTLGAMRAGMPAIAQGYLSDGRWQGRADVLLRVDAPSNLGEWSYEVADTKLSQETKGGTILQLCLYSELVNAIQGFMPEQMHVIVPGRDFLPETFRLHDYLAYYRFVKARLERVVSANEPESTYPDPVDQCEICSWWPLCNDRRRQDDHLSFVAGMSKLYLNQLREWGVTTLAGLATMPLPLRNRPDRGSPDTYGRIREQARLQLEYRTTSSPVHELLDLEPQTGLARLPAPSPGDIFLDFEADPFVDTEGLEYLLGYICSNELGESQYTPIWSFSRSEERRAFESFIDFVMQRRERHPDLHIYHFAHYETSALKRLMGRYGTRQDEMDRLLRAGIFVDLHMVVKQSLRASVEKYSLKDLEVFHGFVRETPLQEARQNLRILECALELDDISNISPDVLNTVANYNREDCQSTLQLRDWLERLREEQVRAGRNIPRPAIVAGDPTEIVDERRRRVLDLMERLLQGAPLEISDQTNDQHARWLLAQMLEWHRREDKSLWWEYFRLRDLRDDERLEDRAAIAGLRFVQRIGGTERSPIDRYEFPDQETNVQEGDHLEITSGSFGEVRAINIENRTIDVKKRGAMAETHPGSAFIHNMVSSTELADSLFRFATWVADNSMDVAGRYRAGRDLLLRIAPRLQAGSPSELLPNGYGVVENAKRLGVQLAGGVLPLQGPPGAGKTFVGARMVCSLIHQNKKVGITAVSHKVIRKLSDEVLLAAREEQLSIHGIQKVAERAEIENPAITETTNNQQILTALTSGEAHFAAGTAWLWSRPEFAESVDVLFIDEAGQMSLADVLAVSQAARSIVLLGDPQQLEQPLMGVHPPGVAVSALQHILGDRRTIPPESGLFLSETWRLSPSICRYISETFYENRLESHDRNSRQRLLGRSRFAGSGLWVVPVEHDGNQSSSEEEVRVVANIVRDLLESGPSWVDLNGVERSLELRDILIVSPYNAQVFNLARRLPGARIGTVDKFQGQEAAVVIYSMATSSPEDAPHGMEFLYNLHRLNVAISRARCASILVASPRLFEPECKTPHHMKLANALCRYVELANVAEIMRR